MIDSHCHLGIDEYKENIDTVLSRAKENGVTDILTVACSYSDIDDLINMSLKPNVYTAFGIHPENAKSFNYQKSKDIYTAYPQIKAVGEIGLDYFYNPQTKDEQLVVFQSQIELAHELKKPIIIHTREADIETIEILKNSYQKGLLLHGGVMHCFCGSYDLAKVALDVGFYISVSGIITFKNASTLRETIQKIPLNRLMIETDAPYLAPVPFRGKQNEPAYVKHTLQALSVLKGEELDVVENQTTRNFLSLFLGE